MNRLLQRWRQWLWPQTADHPPLRLTQRRIYVLPTRAGLLFAATLAVMLVGSINYSLSLGYALTFLLGGLGIVAIVQSFRNLADLQLAPDRHAPGFAGTIAHFGIHLHSQRPRGTIELQLADGPADWCQVQNDTHVQLAVTARQRGWLQMPRLTLRTTWPLGLVRAWSHVRFAEQCLVYPAPQPEAPKPPDSAEGRHLKLDDPDDFYGLRPHRMTDLPQHVAWKASARLDDQLLSKQFAAAEGSAHYFDLGSAPGANLEEKLSVLTRWVLDAHQSRLSFGLQLGKQRIDTAPSSSEHLHACLQALALYV